MPNTFSFTYRLSPFLSSITNYISSGSVGILVVIQEWVGVCTADLMYDKHGTSGSQLDKWLNKGIRVVLVW